MATSCTIKKLISDWSSTKHEIGQVNFEIIGLAEIVTERNGSRTYTQQPDGLNKTKCRQVHSLQQIVSFLFYGCVRH